MREIKFRGKRVDNGEWVYGYYGELTDGEESKSYIMTSTITFVNGKHIYFTDNEVDTETVGEYTGLNGKNGVEIFEGDIIRWHDIVTADYPITFTDGVFCLDERTDENLHHHRCEIESKWEVIGNIYEHPHLLREAPSGPTE